MTKAERLKIEELLDALAMIAYGASTDESHYRRLATAVKVVTRMIKRDRKTELIGS